jgi:hypothetical protein
VLIEAMLHPDLVIHIYFVQQFRSMMISCLKDDEATTITRIGISANAGPRHGTIDYCVPEMVKQAS